MKTAGKLTMALFTAMLLCSNGSAQLFSDFNFRFKTYTTSDGLAHNSVKKCLSDSKGFLWCATENGLSRFDGYQFRNYRHVYNDSSSLPVNDLWDIAIDDNDLIYVSYKTGIAVLDPVTGIFTVLTYNNKKITAEAITWNRKNKTVFIFSSTGLFAYNTGTKTMTQTSLKTKVPLVIWQLYSDNADYIWALVERKGYFRYDISKDSSYYYDSEDWPVAMYQDESGHYYLSTWGSGFQVFDDIKYEHRKDIYQLKLADLPGSNYVFDGISEAPLLTGKDILWVATQTNGIGLYSKSKRAFVHHITYNPKIKNGITHSFYWGFYASPNGTLWICGWHGLTKVNPQDQFFQSAELPELHSAYYNCITGIMDDPKQKNIAYVGVLGNGVAVYNKLENKITGWFYHDEVVESNHYLERWPLRFYKDSNDVIWSSSYGGLIKIINGKASFVYMKDNDAYAYAESSTCDSKGYLWQAGHKLFQFNPYTGKHTVWKFDFTGKKETGTHGVCEGKDRMFYIASDEGLLFADEKTGKTGRIFFEKELPDSEGWKQTWSVAVIDSMLFIGTKKGLAAYNLATKKTTVIGASKDLISIGTNSFYTDYKKNLWIYSSNGLFRYNMYTGRLDHFTSADGIYSLHNDPSYFFDYNGSTYLGYRMSYTKFNTEYINSNTGIPVPHITGITTKNTSGGIAGTAATELNHRNNNISFEFTAIEYNFPEKLTFSYRLEGFDDNWSVPSGERKKSYTNLPPGKYVFRVKAYNNNGAEGSTVAAYSFQVKAAFWQTAWFRLMLVCLIIGAGFYFYRSRIRKLQKRQDEKNRLQQVQLEQYKQQLELEQIINYFATSLSDKNTQEEVIWDVARNLIQQLGFKDCIIYLWNDDKTVLLQKAGYDQTGALGETDKPEFTVKPWQGIVGHVAATKKPVLITDTSKDERYRPDALVRGSELCVPALYGDELISIIDSEDYEKNYYTQQHLQILTTIATLMAAKLVSLRADQETRKKKEELSALNKQMAEKEIERYKQELETEQITSFFSGSLIDKKNVKEVLTDVAKNLIGKMGFEDCMIYLWNAEKTKLVQHSGHGIKGAIENTADKEKYHIPAGQGIVGAAVAGRQPVMVNDTSTDPRYISADGIIRLSELCVPVMDNDEVIGAINIEQTEKNYFTKQHVQKVSTIATLMGSKIRAIESTGALHQKQLELAETSKQLAEREIAMLRSQMNPHFIFNSLNSVQKYIWENKEEDAAEYLASFAKLMRSILENSRHEFISLKKETEFLKLYTELENRRSNNSFNYTIKIDETLDPDKVLIPPMLLQPFIENAIWHGLNKKEQKGNLLVHIYKEGSQLVCIVDDDGVGRSAGAMDGEGKKSLGISITRQRVERLMENTSQSAAVYIKDKTNNDVPSGTQVTVILPLQTNPQHA